MGLSDLAGLGTLLVVLTSVTSFLAFTLHAVSFGTPNWLVAVRPSGFEKIGWHRACFTQCYHPYCPGGPQFIYDGCWWIYDIYFREVHAWLRTDWYLRCRILAIANVPLVFFGFLLSSFASCVVGYWRYPRVKTRCRDISIESLMICAIALYLTSAVLMLITVAEFSMNAFSHDWMPMPEKNALGYSFWLEVASCILLLICVVMGILAVIIKMVANRTPKPANVADDMMMGIGLQERGARQLPVIKEAMA